MIIEPILPNTASCFSTHPTPKSKGMKIPWQSATFPATTRKRHLLLIDGEEDRRYVTRAGLELMTDWQIWVASSYQEGFNFARTQSFHAILINLDANPLGILQQLLSHPATQHIPIILTVDRLRCADAEYFSQLGVAGAIAQPYDCVNLGGQIADFLNWQGDRD
ncbi:MAG: two-component system response regulator [Cyanobacteria bacterium SBLK]|nr:two-component system response regulator [Cyanobacteria bacterium SBLK]